MARRTPPIDAFREEEAPLRRRAGKRAQGPSHPPAMEMTMHLYLLDVYMDDTKHDFRLVIDGDDSSSEKGRWSVTPPGDYFLSGLDGKWRLMRGPGSGSSTPAAGG